MPLKIILKKNEIIYKHVFKAKQFMLCRRNIRNIFKLKKIFFIKNYILFLYKEI